MKKRILAMLTAALVMAAAVPVFAASPTADTTTAVAGQTAKTTVTGAGTAQTKAAVSNMLNDLATLGEALDSPALKAAASNPNATVTATILDERDITTTSDGVTQNADGTYTVKMTSASIAANDLVFVVHNHSEFINPTVAAGSVTFNRNSAADFSPFALVKVDISTGGVSSPTTGDTVPMVAVLFGGCAIAALAFTRKRNA